MFEMKIELDLFLKRQTDTWSLIYKNRYYLFEVKMLAFEYFTN